jgi:hypothetical protein
VVASVAPPVCPRAGKRSAALPTDMGPDGDPSFVARQPALACNPANNQCLVVWYGNDEAPPLSPAESEIFGQRIGFDVHAVLRNVRAPGRNVRFVMILFEDSDHEKRRFRSPFQPPTCNRIRVATRDLNNDGVADQVMVSALFGVRRVKRIRRV